MKNIVRISLSLYIVAACCTTLVFPQQLRVNTMPGYSLSPTYGNAVIGRSIEIWGNAHGGADPLHYTLNYGDGTSDTGTVADRRYIGQPHTYATEGSKTIVLTVTDKKGAFAQSQSFIQVFAAATGQTGVNMAVEKGLLYNYKNQYPSGYWYDGYGSLSATGAAVLAFEENGHLPANNPRFDIYAEAVQAGLDFLFGKLQSYYISAQPQGNPDGNGNGMGAAFGDGEISANGIAALAVLSSQTTQADAKAAIVGAGPYAGSSYYDLAVDLVDQLAFSQTDPVAGALRGGWSSSVIPANSGAADNAATQWACLLMETAQNSWNVPVPQYVKDELLLWLQYSQNGNGGFGASTPDDKVNIAKTGAGIVDYAFLGYTSDSPAVASAIGYLNANWSSTVDPVYGVNHLNGNLSAMYAVTEGLRLIDHRTPVVNVGSHNWFNEYAAYLLNDPSYGQRPDGSWQSGIPTWLSPGSLPTSLALLVLTQHVVLQPPVAFIAPLAPKPPAATFTVDGSGSFHQAPSKNLVEWLWDFDASDGVDWDHPNATGQRPVNPGYPVAGNYTITLRVKDNSDPPLYCIQTALVIIDTGRHTPVAVAIPPQRGFGYAAKIGETIQLDGRASFSPDYPRDSVVRYNWDTNGDGAFGDAATPTPGVVFHSEYQGHIGLRVYNVIGDSSAADSYIPVFVSGKDLAITNCTALPAIVDTGGSITLMAVCKNDNGSNAGASNILVRFYEGNPLTTGHQIGADCHVTLPVGQTDTARVTIDLPENPPLGIHKYFAMMDPGQTLAEWNKINNLDSTSASVVEQLPEMHITTIMTGSGTVTPSGIVTVIYGGERVFTYAPAFNYHIDSVWLDNIYIGSDSTDTVSNIIANHTLTVKFAVNSCSITASAAPHGAITPAGVVWIGYNGAISFNIHPVTGYHIDSVKVDGAAVTPDSIYTFHNVTAAHTIAAIFAVNRYVITASATGRGSIIPGTSVSVNYLEDATIQVQPDIGYAVDSMYVDGGGWKIADTGRISYTFHSVASDHTFRATFDVLPGFRIGFCTFSYADLLTNDPVRKDNLGEYCDFTITNKTSATVNEVNLEFFFDAVQVNCGGPMTASGFQKDWTLTGTIAPGNSITFSALVGRIAPQYIPRLWFGPATGKPAMINVRPNAITTCVRMPNVANVRDTLWTKMQQKRYSFQVGIQRRDSANYYGWIIMHTRFDMFQSLSFSRSMHTEINNGFLTFNDGSPFTKPHRMLIPQRQNNKTFADLVVLKFNLALSDLGITPQGLGQLRYTDPGNPFDGMRVAEIVTLGDSMMTFAKWSKWRDHPELYGKLDTTLININGAFNGQVDTLSWTTGLRLAAAVRLIDQPYLLPSTSSSPALPPRASDESHTDLPKDFALYQNYPNPFNPTTDVGYRISDFGYVTLKIFNTLGQEMTTLVNEMKEPGEYHIQWNATGIPSGVYFYRLNVEPPFNSHSRPSGQFFTDVKKMMIVK